MKSDGLPRKVNDGWGGYPSGLVGDLLRRPDVPSVMSRPASNLRSGTQSAASENKVQVDTYPRLIPGGGRTALAACRYVHVTGTGTCACLLNRKTI